MLNINLQKFGKAQAILIFPCRIFRRYMVYNSDAFIDHTHWRSKNEMVARIELLELNTWSPSKRGMIVMIGSPNAFLKLQSSLVALKATVSVGGPLVVRVSYVR